MEGDGGLKAENSLINRRPTQTVTDSVESLGKIAQNNGVYSKENNETCFLFSYAYPPYVQSHPIGLNRALRDFWQSAIAQLDFSL